MQPLRSRFEVSVNSEIGELQGVVLHTPGPEIENMTPANAERALYSDVLNLSVVTQEYNQLKQVMEKITNAFQIDDLLADVLESSNSKFRQSFIHKICLNENALELEDDLLDMSNKQLATCLVEGMRLKRDNLSRFLSNERYALRPLHNFFFTRDISVVINDWVLVSKMASKVRSREALIMEAVFDHHPMLSVETFDLDDVEEAHIEGGDVHVVRDDILLVGCGLRTNPAAIDHLIEHYKKLRRPQHIVVQQLPSSPESFIHLDMVFTILDYDICMVYAPVVLQPSPYKTVLISIDNGNVLIDEETNILTALAKLGMGFNPVICGGSSDLWIQEREQWHSGANFFAMAPGKIIGYGRNINTIEALDKAGFSIVDATEIIEGKADIKNYNRCVVTIDGSELARGGGGCRCMTMPISRKPIVMP